MPFLSITRLPEAENRGGIRKREGERREASGQVQGRPLRLWNWAESCVLVSAPRFMLTHSSLLVQLGITPHPGGWTQDPEGLVGLGGAANSLACQVLL